MKEFVSIKGYEGFYSINKYGQIWSYKKNRLLKPSKCDGYFKLRLSKNGEKCFHSVHRLIAEAFIPNPENKPQINHKNCNGYDNDLNNLEWVTAYENLMHAIANGRLNTTEHKLKIRQSNRKLSDNEVLSIRKLYESRNYSQRQLAAKFNVCQRTITMIVNKITFREVS